jgi:hypothetical protein
MAAFTLPVNEQRQKGEVDPATALLYILSDDLELRPGTIKQPHPMQRAHRRAFAGPRPPFVQRTGRS